MSTMCLATGSTPWVWVRGGERAEALNTNKIESGRIYVLNLFVYLGVCVVFFKLHLLFPVRISLPNTGPRSMPAGDMRMILSRLTGQRPQSRPGRQGIEQTPPRFFGALYNKILSSLLKCCELEFSHFLAQHCWHGFEPGALRNAKKRETPAPQRSPQFSWGG